MGPIEETNNVADNSEPSSPDSGNSCYPVRHSSEDYRVTGGPVQSIAEHEIHNEACGCIPPPEPMTFTVGAADLGASKPVPQPVYKQRPVQHSVVVACGHALEAGHFPRQANCEDCWYALFETTPEGVASVHSLLMQEGTQAVERMHGRKFLKAFGRYLQKKLWVKMAKVEENIAEVTQGGL